MHSPLRPWFSLNWSADVSQPKWPLGRRWGTSTFRLATVGTTVARRTCFRFPLKTWAWLDQASGSRFRRERSCRASQQREARAEGPASFFVEPARPRFFATLVRLDAYLSKDVLLMARSRDMTRRTPLPVRTWQMPFDGAIVSHRPPSFTGTSSPEVRSATVTRANSPEAGSHVLAAPGAWG